MKIRAFRYTPEMVDCHYCTEYTRKPPHCKVPTCTCIAERIEAGVVGYREAVNGCFAGKTAISDRLQTIVENFPNSLWLDAAHRERMEHLKAVLHFYRKRNTPKWYAALYLLSSSENLHRRTINCFTKKTIEFSKAQLSGISPADYSELLNSLDSGCNAKITIHNHRLNRQSFEQSILMPMQADGCDEYRVEYNQMLIDKANSANGLTQEKYITVSVFKKDISEARAYTFIKNTIPVVAEEIGTAAYNTFANEQKNKGAFVMDASSMDIETLLSRSQKLVQDKRKESEK